MPDVTLVCANAGMTNAFQLMWESFLAFHDRQSVHLLVLNMPAQEAIPVRECARDYTAQMADEEIVPESFILHGRALDRLCMAVKTPYTLVVDSDVQFSGPALTAMQAWLLGGFCVCPSQRGDMGRTELYGLPTKGQPRIDPCCALLKTETLHRMLPWVSWCSYGSRDLEAHYDVGSMLYHAAMACGERVAMMEAVWNHIHHYGCVSWGAYAPEGSPIRAVADERYALITRRLAELRSARGDVVSAMRR